MKTHYITKAKWDKAIAAPSPMALLTLRGTCGAKSTARATLDLNYDPAAATCENCIAYLTKVGLR